MLSRLNTIVAIGVFASCTPKQISKNGGDKNGSGLKTVTINQPDLKNEMKASVSEADKTKVYDSLMYQISINAQKRDGKDDCDTGVSPSTFDSGVVGMTKKDFAEIKVKKGCNYLVSMKIGAKSEDGKAIKTVYLSSWDDKEPAVLLKQELEKDKPNVAVKLFVTAEGKEFWDAESIITPTDADTTITPSIAKPNKFTGTTNEVKFDKITGDISVAALLN